MKKIKKYIGMLVFVFAVSAAFAQTPPPPNNNGSGSGSPGNTVVGGGAPVGNGLILLSIMAGAYGFARYSKSRPEYTIVE